MFWMECTASMFRVEVNRVQRLCRSRSKKGEIHIWLSPLERAGFIHWSLQKELVSNA
jgi:hypothetical protein